MDHIACLNNSNDLANGVKNAFHPWDRNTICSRAEKSQDDLASKFCILHGS